MLFFKKTPQFKLPKNFNPGAFQDRLDSRDKPYSEIVMCAPQIDWKKGYNVENVLNHRFEIETQGSSSSCVGQAWSKYLEILNFAEENKFKNLSAKFIYSQIFLPSGGSYIREGAKLAVKQGDALEKTIPSYQYVALDNGNLHRNPPTEEFMRDSTGISDDVRQEALNYQSKEYRSIDSSDKDLLAHAIMNNHGAVSGALGDNKGWGGKDKKDFIVKKPTSNNPWGHAYIYTGFGQDSRGDYFDFINSWDVFWGNEGRGRMYYDEYDMANNTFGAWTLVDKKNIIDNNNNDNFMFRLIQMENDPNKTVWWIGGDGKRRYFFNENQFNAISHALGIKDGFASLEILPKDQFNLITVADPMVVIK